MSLNGALIRGAVFLEEGKKRFCKRHGFHGCQFFCFPMGRTVLVDNYSKIKRFRVQSASVFSCRPRRGIGFCWYCEVYD
jgi:hypothetical protein